MVPTQITISTKVSADRMKTWEYYTQPQHITQWNFATDEWHCPSATNDLRVGGKYYARMEAKDGSFGFDYEAIYNNIAYGESISYTLLDGRPVNVKFKDVENQTEITVTFEAEATNPVEMQKAGWQAILDNFKKYADTH